jgi:hypothetical protein
MGAIMDATCRQANQLNASRQALSCACDEKDSPDHPARSQRSRILAPQPITQHLGRILLTRVKYSGDREFRGQYN